MKRISILSVMLYALTSMAVSETRTHYVCSDDSCYNHVSGGTIDLGEEVINVEHLFIPKGFDENDHVQVMVYGHLPNPCFRRAHAEAKRDGDHITVTVKATRRINPNRVCIEMAVPFLLPVDVGHIKPGDYTVSVSTNSANPAKLHVEAQSGDHISIDDFLYANVSSVEVDAKTRVVTLKGENPSPCLELDQIFSTSNGENTYAVMPVVKKKEDVECTAEETPFVYTYQLPDDLNAKKVLVHVRTLEGNSKNKVFVPRN